MSATLFVDMMSQPSRAVVLFARLAGVPDTRVQAVQIAKGQHKLPEHLRRHPDGKVPALHDTREGRDVTVWESHAMLQYLCNSTPGLDDAWYPSDPVRRARVDTLLHWHHGNLRQGAAGLCFAVYLAPVRGIKLPPGRAAAAEKLLRASLRRLNDTFLEDGRPFLAGADRPSIADLSLACELVQAELGGFSDLSGYPRVEAWLRRMKALPHWADTHSVFNRVLAKFLARGGASAPHPRL